MPVSTRQTSPSSWSVDVAAATVGSKGRAAFHVGVYSQEAAALAAARHSAPPEWEDTDQCSRCGQGFGLLRRRSHCRNCGFCFCKPCTKHWPRAALPQSFTEGDKSAFGTFRVCLSCDAAAQQMRAALLNGDADAARRAYGGGQHNVNLACPLPPAAEGQPALLLPVHLAAAADSLATLQWLSVDEGCPIVGPGALSLGHPAKSVLRVAIEAQAVDCLQWLIGGEGVPQHVGIPVSMPLDSGCAPAAVHRALEAALRDLAAQRRLVEFTIEAAEAQRAALAPSGGDVLASVAYELAREALREL